MRRKGRSGRMDERAALAQRAQHTQPYSNELYAERCIVYECNRAAGELVRKPDGFWFTYDREYLQDPNATSISVMMPLREEPYHSPMLFQVFRNILERGINTWMHPWTFQMDPDDEMSQLAGIGVRMIGTVHVEHADPEKREKVRRMRAERAEEVRLERQKREAGES